MRLARTTYMLSLLLVAPSHGSDLPNGPKVDQPTPIVLPNGPNSDLPSSIDPPNGSNVDQPKPIDQPNGPKVDQPLPIVPPNGPNTDLSSSIDPPNGSNADQPKPVDQPTVPDATKAPQPTTTKEDPPAPVVTEPPTPVIVEKPTPVTEGCPVTDWMNNCRMTIRGGNKECVVLDGVCQKMTISEDGCPDIAHFLDLHLKNQFNWIHIKNICLDFDGCEMWNNWDCDEYEDPGCVPAACAKEDPFIPPAPVTLTPPVTEGCPDTDDDLDCRWSSRGGNKECVFFHDVCQRLIMSEDGCPDIHNLIEPLSWAEMNNICTDFDGCQIWNNPNCDYREHYDNPNMGCDPAMCSKTNLYIPTADPTEQPTPVPTIQPTEAYTEYKGICTDSEGGRNPPPLEYEEARHFDITLERCEELCTSNGACTAFDYGPQKKISDTLPDRKQCNIYHSWVVNGFVTSKTRTKTGGRGKKKGIGGIIGGIKIRTNYKDNTCYINDARFKEKKNESVKVSFGAIVVIPVVIVGCLIVGALWIRTRRKKAAKAQENVDSGVVHTNAQENMV